MCGEIQSHVQLRSTQELVPSFSTAAWMNACGHCRTAGSGGDGSALRLRRRPSETTLWRPSLESGMVLENLAEARDVEGAEMTLVDRRSDRFPVGPEPRHRPHGARRVQAPRRFDGLAFVVVYGRSQENWHHVRRRLVWFLPDWRRRGVADSTQLAAPEGTVLSADLQPDVHDARHHDDLPVRDANGRCLRELLVPLQIGARDVAFPVNAFGFWCFCSVASSEHLVVPRRRS